jgi:hypothetical protein
MTCASRTGRLLAALLLAAALASCAAAPRRQLGLPRHSLLAAAGTQCFWTGGTCLPSEASIIGLGVPSDADDSEM